MQREEVLNEIVPLCRKAFAKPDLEITEDLDSAKVDSWTSLSFMHLLNDIENHFGLKFKIMELLNIRDIGSLVNVIASHL